MSVGRSGKMAMMFLTVDREVPPELVSKIASEIGTDDIKSVRFLEGLSWAY
jgi:hypothetical protein